MKILKRFALLFVGIALLVCAGCNNVSYQLYTNIPQGSYNITDKSYKFNQQIQGYTLLQTEYEQVDTSNFTSMGRSYTAMFSDADLVVSADFDKDGETDNFKQFYSAVGSELLAIDRAVTTFISNSDLTVFNNADGGEQVEISLITYEILNIAYEMYELTEGYYNPALYYNVNAYGFGNAQNYPENASQLPDDSTVAKYTELASHFNEIEIYETDGKYYVKKPSYTVDVDGETLSMKLDLSGIGKGYAVDKVDELFDKYGYKYGYFNFGSSSMLVKSHYQQGAYNMSFVGPRSITRQTYFECEIRNEKLSTSGDNNQFYIIDGVRYCHVFNPFTGKPVQTGIMSVSVIGGSAAKDDALTTALMAMGKEKAISFIEEHLNDRKVVFVCE